MSSGVLGSYTVGRQAGPAKQGRWPNGLRATARPVPRYRLQLALATSLAAACIHYVHQPSQSTAVQCAVRSGPALSSSTVPKSQAHSAHVSARRGHLRRYATTSEGSGGVVQEQASQLDADFHKGSGHASSSRDAAELTNTDDINALMRHPALLEHIKAPRNPIVLCHGLYGFDVRGPFWGLEIHYWATVLDILRKKVGAEVIVCGVPGTGAIADRAHALHKYLISPEAGVRGKQLNFIGHSMGGLDARYLISVIKPAPEEYTPVSLTTLSTPHRGSPFMDWCNANVGTGNDRVEKEIREARKKLKSMPHQEAQDTPDGQRSQETKDEFEKYEIVKPPFSLKTPLFVRPSSKPAENDVDGESGPSADKVQAAASGVTEDIARSISTPAPTSSVTDKGSNAAKNKEAEKKKKDSGSSLLDFGAFNKALSSLGGSFSSYMLGVLDQPAYAMLSTRYMAQVFNPTVPDSPNVSYFSVASRKRSLPIYHPLWLPKQVLDSAAESRSADGERDGSAEALGSTSQGNDGLVSVESAKWGRFLGVIEGCDHWDLRGGGAPRWRGKNNPQTGKPLATSRAEKGKEELQETDKKSRDGAWGDINRLVRSLFSARADGSGVKNEAEVEKRVDKDPQKADQKKESQQENDNDDGKSSLKDAVASIVPGVNKAKDDQGLIDEVANWISERLPIGDKERRAQAEKAADAQDKERESRFFKEGEEQHKVDTSSASTSPASSPPSSPSISTSASSTSRASSSSSSSSPDSNSSSDTASERSQPSPPDFDAMKTAVKLRREAAWQEELGHTDAARELRRELAWHRAEWDRALASGKAPTSITDRRRSGSTYPVNRELDWDAHMKRRAAARADASSTSKKDTSPSSSSAELERFWIALCRHLWAQGH